MEIRPLILTAKYYINQGIYDPEVLYRLVQEVWPYKHYSLCRKAVQEAKCGLIA